MPNTVAGLLACCFSKHRKKVVWFLRHFLLPMYLMGVYCEREMCASSYVGPTVFWMFRSDPVLYS